MNYHFVHLKCNVYELSSKLGFLPRYALFFLFSLQEILFGLWDSGSAGCADFQAEDVQAGPEDRKSLAAGEENSGLPCVGLFVTKVDLKVVLSWAAIHF